MYEDKILMFNSSSNVLKQVKVVSYEPEIGFTVVDAENNNSYELCIHGPLSPYLSKKYWENNPNLLKAYYKIMDNIKNCIDNNLTIDYNQLNSLLLDNSATSGSKAAGSSTCAFNQ